jgi:FkbM family methyltransferase
MRDIKVTLGDTINGPMLYLAHDMYVGRSLDLYGEFSKGEQELFAFAAQKGGTAIDVGANLGAHSMMMAKCYEHLFAFEPQPTLHKLLRGNLSPFLNTTTYNAACGNNDGLLDLPQVNYGAELNFGGIGRECLDHLPDEQRKEISMFKIQSRMLDRCDAIQAAEKISLIKVDVEGMEKEVLEGARKTISKHQPILYVENDKPAHSKALVDYIYNVLAYRAWWHVTFLYNPANFKHNAENVFPNIASYNLICVPEGHWLKIQNAKPCAPENPGLPENCVS